MDVKQSTLRPEIQLLNSLLSATSSADRKQARLQRGAGSAHAPDPRSRPAWHGRAHCNHGPALLFPALQILNRSEAQEQLVMNDRYFFGLLDHMALDVNRQPENPQKAELVRKLRDIRSESVARLPSRS